MIEPTRSRFAFYRLVVAGGLASAVLVVSLGAWMAYEIWQWRSFAAELEAADKMVSSWKHRGPPGVAAVDWEDACQTVQISLVNVVYPPAVSLDEVRRLRAELEQRDRQPITAETLQWLLWRLSQTGPNGAEYIQRMQPWWEESLDRVGGTTLQRARPP